MTYLAEYDDLSFAVLHMLEICFLYALLELQDYWTCAVNDLESKPLSCLVCLRRLAMCPDQQSLSTRFHHLLKVLLVDSYKPFLYES